MATDINFPAGKYRVILADPPWFYRKRGRQGCKHASAHYPVMSLDHIKALPVGDLAADDCALFLWTVRWLPPKDEAAVLDAWGFEFKCRVFRLVKLTPSGTPVFGMGHWSRSGAEDCVLATRGHIRPAAHDVPEVQFAPVREHSRKPDSIYDAIERLTGTKEPGDKIELFARQAWPGWDCWGLETDKFGEERQQLQGVLL